MTRPRREPRLGLAELLLKPLIWFAEVIEFPSTFEGVDPTIPLTDEEQFDLTRAASRGGMSIEQVAKLAIVDFLGRRPHRMKVGYAADAIMVVHGDALDRLGQ